MKMFRLVIVKLLTLKNRKKPGWGRDTKKNNNLSLVGILGPKCQCVQKKRLVNWTTLKLACFSSKDVIKGVKMQIMYQEKIIATQNPMKGLHQIFCQAKRNQ